MKNFSAVVEVLLGEVCLWKADGNFVSLSCLTAFRGPLAGKIVID